MKRVTPILLITIFLTSMFIVPSAFVIGSLRGNTNTMNIDASPESQALISQISHDARVAIYDEDNLTAPAISEALNLTNNLAEITTLLEGAGHSVDLLTETDILAHKLTLADYDVFILVNNVPRPSIANLVKEFWLGGGGLMSFNGAMSYLWYGGILDPSITTDQMPSKWMYLPSDTQNVSARHPTMKDYHINETISERSEYWATTADVVLDSLDIGYYTTIMLRNMTFTPFLTAFAVDINSYGGRIIQLPGDGFSIPSAFESIIVDSVEWLIPQPKGRIAYDLTHSPRLCVDIWDTAYATVWDPTHNFEQLRTLAVNHTYTFDKLYPSATGNLTAERLAKYDVLIIDWPDLNYTTAEYLAVEAWVNDGGSLLVLGDRTELGGDGYIHINLMLRNFDMSLGTTNIVPNAIANPETHVTLEECASLAIGARNYLSVIGTADIIWSESTYPVVAGQQFGQGRAILAGDMNIFDSEYLPEQSNKYFALNVLNWLTASEATTLLFTTWMGHYNDAAEALRDLGMKFQLTTSNSYLVDFIDSEDWELVIIDQSNTVFSDTQLDKIYAYVNAGGKLIMSYHGINWDDTHPVWSKLGVEYSADLSGEPTLYLWDETHPIFNKPNDHSTANYTAGVLFADDGDSVTVLEGFTALAGRTANEQADNAFIVLGNDGKTLFNSYLIDGLITDIDDSTYLDSVELWQNEIVFMTTPPGGGFNLDTTTLLIIGGAVLALIVIGALFMRRRSGGSKPKPKPKKTTKKK